MIFTLVIIYKGSQYFSAFICGECVVVVADDKLVDGA